MIQKGLKNLEALIVEAKKKRQHYDTACEWLQSIQQSRGEEGGIQK